MDFFNHLFFFIIAIGILISFHEFGHFWVARKVGVKVLRFSVGFGKVLWSRQKHPEDTQYVVSAIPLGGYVKMVDEREAPVKPEDLPYAFNRKPLWARSAIVFAGPAFNIAFAVLMFWGVLVLGESGLRAKIGEIKPSTLAAAAGFQEGDEILSINDKPAKSWIDAMNTVITDAMDGELAINIKVKNDAGETATKVLNLKEEDIQDSEILYKNIGFSPWFPKYKPIIAEVMPDSAALTAGLKKDDIIIKADQTEITGIDQWIDYIKQHPNKTIQLTIERDGAELVLPITPKAAQNEDGSTEGKIGAAMAIPQELRKSLLVEYSLSPLEAIPAAFKKTYENAVFTVRMFGRMLTGKASVKNLSGPISIAKFAGQSANMGLVHFINFMGLVSLGLGVLNLMPIPVLDGGHLLFFGIEAIKGGPLPEKTQLFFQQIGLALLFLLMATAMVVDVQRLFE